MDLNMRIGRRAAGKTDEEAREIIANIPTLRDMFLNYPDYKGDLFGDHDNTNGILYQSRLHANEHRPTKSTGNLDLDGETNSKAPKDVVVTQETADITLTTSARNKKRKFAMSLATLAAKPHKREKIVSQGAVLSLIDLSQLNDVPIRK
jgi:hypothetical protein